MSEKLTIGEAATERETAAWENVFNGGGPAFPYSALAPGGPSMYADNTGMKLRDYFAAKAMQAQVQTDMVPGPACDELCKKAAEAGQSPLFRLAINSYKIADAMLMAREFETLFEPFDYPLESLKP